MLNVILMHGTELAPSGCENYVLVCDVGREQVKDTAWIWQGYQEREWELEKLLGNVDW